MNLADGLKLGSGIQSQLVGPDRGVLKIDISGDISCYNRSSGLLEAITSLHKQEAFVRVSLEAGGLTISDTSEVTAARETVRRIDPDASERFKVSLSNYPTVGGL